MGGQQAAHAVFSALQLVIPAKAGIQYDAQRRLLPVRPEPVEGGSRTGT